MTILIAIAITFVLICGVIFVAGKLAERCYIVKFTDSDKIVSVEDLAKLDCSLEKERQLIFKRKSMAVYVKLMLQSEYLKIGVNPPDLRIECLAKLEKLPLDVGKYFLSYHSTENAFLRFISEKINEQDLDSK